MLYNAHLYTVDIREKPELVAKVSALFEPGPPVESTTFLAIAPFDSNMVLMQYTNLNDETGKEIYCGDVLEIPVMTSVGLVAYKGVMDFNVELAQFGVSFETELNLPPHIVEKRKPRLLGNIYEHPDLLGDSLHKIS